MWSVAIVINFPLFQFCLDVNVINIVNELPEFLLIGPVRPLDLAIQMWRSWLDIDMPNAEILTMPVEFGLELVAIIGLDSVNSEWKSLADVVNELDGVFLRMPIINLQGPGARGVIDGSILKAPDLFAIPVKSQELYIDLNPMAGDLLLISFKVFY